MTQLRLIGKVSKLCELRLYDEAIRLTNSIENKTIAIKAHMLCMEHEQRARIDGKLYDYRELYMSSTDFHLDVDSQIAAWLKRYDCLPCEIYVMEFMGRGDAYFGGNADDRLLCESGNIWDGTYPKPAAKIFSSIEQAATAAWLITNRRPNSVLGVIPFFDWEIKK